MNQQIELLELTHDSDPRYLLAPLLPPDMISLDDLIRRRYGKLLTAQVGVVVARYYKKEGTDDWCLLA